MERKVLRRRDGAMFQEQPEQYEVSRPLAPWETPDRLTPMARPDQTASYQEAEDLRAWAEALPGGRAHEATAFTNAATTASGAPRAARPVPPQVQVQATMGDGRDGEVLRDGEFGIQIGDPAYQHPEVAMGPGERLFIQMPDLNFGPESPTREVVLAPVSIGPVSAPAPTSGTLSEEDMWRLGDKWKNEREQTQEREQKPAADSGKGSKGSKLRAFLNSQMAGKGGV